MSQVTSEVSAIETTKISEDKHCQVHKCLPGWQYTMYGQKYCVEDTRHHILVKFEKF